MTVFIVQEQKWVDPVDGQLKPKFDFSTATAHGQIEFLLHPSASPFNLEPAIATLQERLAGFSDQDYLLLTGNPVLLGLAVAIAADINDGDVAMLQWSGAKGTYIPVRAKNVFPDCLD